MERFVLRRDQSVKKLIEAAQSRRLSVWLTEGWRVEERLASAVSVSHETDANEFNACLTTEDALARGLRDRVAFNRLSFPVNPL